MWGIYNKIRQQKIDFDISFFFIDKRYLSNCADLTITRQLTPVHLDSRVPLSRFQFPDNHNQNHCCYHCICNCVICIENNGILLPKLFWPTVRKNCSSDWGKTFQIRCWRPRICKIFEITKTICSNSERSDQFLVTEPF